MQTGKSSRWLGAVIVGVVALAVVIGVEWYWAHDLVWVVARHWIVLTDIAGDQAPTALSDLGNAGELMGGASALFAGLAFIGVAIAVYLQADTLAVQRRQLEHEQQKTADAQRLADAHAARLAAQYARQSFEPLFFRLIELLRSQTSVLLGDLARASGELSKAWGIAITPDSDDAKVNRLVERYSVFYRDHENQLAPYFGALRQALKLVDRSPLANDEKRDYVDVLRAILSGDELLVITLQCLTNDGVELKGLVEKLGLLRATSQAPDGSIGVANELARLRFPVKATTPLQPRPASDVLVD